MGSILSSFFDTSSQNKKGEIELKAIADLTPTPYLIINPKGEYWYHTISDLDNIDYSVCIKNIGLTEGNIYFDLQYCSDQTIGDDNMIGTKLVQEYISKNIKNNILIKKYTIINDEYIPLEFECKDLEWIKTKIQL